MESPNNVTPQKVVSYGHKAAELLKTKGKEGLGILRDPRYEFNAGDTYIFIMDMEESLMAFNPRFPGQRGRNFKAALTLWPV